ncbi:MULTISPECIES: hypothetical protein [Paenibacillus]|uniref:Uncharacterized protein n=1 Tax=Paenibacillus residui TaxID=629724 RepID=A0ABW3DEF3_9BACL|nr:hypothetical protein [Paenibacillus sp. 32O-W]
MEHVIVIDKGKLLLDEEAEALRGRAFTVVGPASKVESFTEGKEMIHRESIGGLVSAAVLGRPGAGEREQAEALGLELASVSLQQLIVYLTSDHSAGRR